jgi:hypothetical protein
MTTYNKLSTLIFDSLYLLSGPYLDKSHSFITVTALANVPPQGKSFLVSRDQMEMGETFIHK